LFHTEKTSINHHITNYKTTNWPRNLKINETIKLRFSPPEEENLEVMFMLRVVCSAHGFGKCQTEETGNRGGQSAFCPVDDTRLTRLYVYVVNKTKPVSYVLNKFRKTNGKTSDSHKSILQWFGLFKAIVSVEKAKSHPHYDLNWKPKGRLLFGARES
jgi:hypothetical protein